MFLTLSAIADELPCDPSTLDPQTASNAMEFARRLPELREAVSKPLPVDLEERMLAERERDIAKRKIPTYEGFLKSACFFKKSED